MASLDTVAPAIAAENLNNLSDVDTSIFLSPDQVATIYNNDFVGFNAIPGAGQTPVDYNFWGGISGALDGLIDTSSDVQWSPRAISTTNNPTATPSSYYPGQQQGIFSNLLAFMAPKPVPLMSPSSAIAPIQRPTLFQTPVAGSVTAGQLIVAALALGAVVMVARA